MTSVQVSPFHRSDFSLAGLLVHGRWPDNVAEWSQVLVLSVRIAAVPGTVPTSEVFRARDDLDVAAVGEPVGALICEGPALGEDAPGPGQFSGSVPPALMVLHPPNETIPDLEEDDGAASGCLFLPGIPELGLEHRATWVQADSEGKVSKLLSAGPVDPMQDPDLAVLSSFLAA